MPTVVLAALLVGRVAHAACGDGTLDGGEACDDGNTLPGDGCSPTCTLETGFSCDTLTPLPVANGGFETAAPGAADGGWEVVSGNMDWVSGTAYNACSPAGEGLYSIDLNGDRQGVIGQSFATVVGTKYAVAFLGDANCVSYSGQSCATQCTRVLTVGVADDTTADDATDCAAAFTKVVYQVEGSSQVTPWQRLRLEFTAQSTKTLVYFSGSDTALAGPMIDDVTIAASDCRKSSCGNGQLDAGEACDDGNTMSGDGCQSDCMHVEEGWLCATAGQACSPPCGDGVVQTGEACDDGNMASGDGCDPTCKVEPHWSCSVGLTGTASTCSCGDGYAPSADFMSCVDMCTTLNGGCDANATCGHAGDGHLTCTCKFGYVGDGMTCAPVPVTLLPSSLRIAPRGTQRFMAMGGSGAGYTFALVGTPASGGAVDATTGVYTAGAIADTTDTLEVTDSLGNKATAPIAVTDALTISPAMAMLSAGGQVMFTAMGGSGAGYTFALDAGSASGATFDPTTGKYVAGTTGGNDTVTVTDSFGNTASAQIMLTATLVVTPSIATVPPRGQQQLRAMGGTGPYQWSVTGGAGGTVSSDGVYTAGPNGSSQDTVVVTDALGATAQADMTIGNGLMIDNGMTYIVYSGRSITLTASGGSGVYTWAITDNKSGGKIDAKGVYTAGSKDGVDTIMVTDALGNTVAGRIIAEEFPDGGCSVGGQGSSPAALVIGLALLCLRRRKRPARSH